MSEDNFIEQKDKILIVFDDLCLICSTAVRLILRFNKKRNFIFTSFSSSYFKTNFSDYFISGDSVLVIANRISYIKSDAVIFILNQLIFPIKLLHFLIWIPKKNRDIIYDFAAKNRFKIFPKLTECNLISSEYSSQFYF